MPRHPRIAPAGLVYHVLNRSVAKIKLFRTDKDFLVFQNLIAEAQRRHPIAILAYCIMSNHWHFIVHPNRDGQLTAFFRWLTHTHAMRWRVAHVGYGPLYQGRFKCFPIQEDQSLIRVCRYVERNPLSAQMVRRAENWKFSSLWVRRQGTDQQQAVLSDWPVPIPVDWTSRVNAPLTAKDRDRIKTSMARSRPFGDDAWVMRTAKRLDLGHTVRPEGRPPKPRPLAKQKT
jgi:putative transposase